MNNSLNHKRPLSPHLQIYKPQITSTLSILHRFAGIVTGFGLFLVMAFLYAAAFQPTFFETLRALLSSPFGLIVLMGFSVALPYHLFAGLRHLAWDLGLGFNLKTVYRTAWLSLILTLALSVYLWLPFIKGFVDA